MPTKPKPRPQHNRPKYARPAMYCTPSQDRIKQINRVLQHWAAPKKNPRP